MGVNDKIEYLSGDIEVVRFYIKRSTTVIFGMFFIMRELLVLNSFFLALVFHFKLHLQLRSWVFTFLNVILVLFLGFLMSSCFCCGERRVLHGEDDISP